MSIKEEIKYFCLGGVIVAIIMTFVIGIIIAIGGLLYFAEMLSEPTGGVVLGCALTLALGYLFYSNGKDIKKKGFWNVLKFKDGSKTQ